jgi:Na+-transporting NADH:ubiquinone oxidoreductase subunit NqrD
MSQPETKHTTPASLAVDAVLVVAFFAFMFGVLKPHVPSNSPRMILAWSAIASSCLTAVFWLCIQMFRVVLRKQLAGPKK